MVILQRGNIEIFYLFARPRRTAQEFQAGLDTGVALEAVNIDALCQPKRATSIVSNASSVTPCNGSFEE
nr:hypothetical protein predicted by Glimmer/Critica [Erwinia amylovora ATCC BAA-2158]